MDRYQGGFAEDHWDGAKAGWPVVQAEFKMSEKEPTEVVLASYTYEGYEGDALVVYRRGRQYFHVSGGHCSCYGLEGQWKPEGPYTKAQLRALIERSPDERWGQFRGFRNPLLKALA